MTVDLTVTVTRSHADHQLQLNAFVRCRKTACSDAFHVIRGEAELKTADGERIKLIASGIYSFPDGFTTIWRTKSSFLKFFVIG